VERMAHYTVPGVAVGIIKDGQEYTAGFGITNVEAPVPVPNAPQINETETVSTGTRLRF